MNESPAKSQAAHLPFVDGLRGMAILGVMAVHLSGHLVWGGATFRNGWLQEFLVAGVRGVQLFFIISAFTLFASSKARFSTDPSPVFNFYIRRAFRILPLWWVTIGIFSNLVGRSAWPSAFMYFGFTRFNADTEVFPLGWSIFVEEFFYLLLPVIFLRIDNLYRALQFVAGSCILAIVWDQFAPKLGIPTGNSFVFLFPLNQWFCFAIGIALFYLMEHPLFRANVIDSRRWAGILDALTGVLLFALIRHTHMAAVVAFSLLFITCMSPHTLFGKLARNRLLGLMGTCCYSIYLFHLLIIQVVPHPNVFFSLIGRPHLSADVQFLITAPLFAAACAVVGIFSWHAFERPCIFIGQRVNAVFNSRRAPESPSSI
jgi:peptidoglycan/LPS O-acetylase OafA/YrhL